MPQVSVALEEETKAEPQQLSAKKKPSVAAKTKELAWDNPAAEPTGAFNDKGAYPDE